MHTSIVVMQGAAHELTFGEVYIRHRVTQVYELYPGTVNGNVIQRAVLFSCMSDQCRAGLRFASMLRKQALQTFPANTRLKAPLQPPPVQNLLPSCPDLLT